MDIEELYKMLEKRKNVQTGVDTSEETALEEKQSPVSVNPLSDTDKGEYLEDKDEKALTEASGVSSILQEILAKKRASVAGKDPTVEINQIRAGQQRLDANLEKKAELKRQLEEKLAQRKQKVAEQEQKKQQFERVFGLKQVQTGIKAKESIETFNLQQDKNNPDSKISVEYRELYKKLLGKEPPPDASAASLEKFISATGGIVKSEITAEQQVLNRKQREKQFMQAGIDSPVPIDFIRSLNESRQKNGLPAIPPTIKTNRQLRAWTDMEDFARKIGQNVITDGSAIPDPNNLTKGSNQERIFNNIENSFLKLDDKIETDRQSLKQLNGLLEGDPTAMDASAAQRIIAQMYNKGALSENDVLAFSGGQTLKQRAERFLGKTFTTGSVLSPEDVAMLKYLGSSLLEHNSKARSELLERKAEYIENAVGEGYGKAFILRFSQPRREIPLTEEVKNLPQKKKPTPVSAPKPASVGGFTKMEKNGVPKNIPNENVEKALSLGWRKVQ